MSTVKPPPIYRWEPKEDITTYELACCMDLLMPFGWIYADFSDRYDRLPEGSKRHFRVEQP
jgi:hypothetical protein